MSNLIKDAERISDLIKAKRKSEHELFSRSGVVAVGVGYRVREGHITDEPAIQVFVERKLPRDKVGGNLLVVDDYPIDVIETKKPVIRVPLPGEESGLGMKVNDGYYGTLTGGIEIGRVGIPGFGTLGSIVYSEATGAPLILSNWHVMAIPGVTSGLAIAQPGNSVSNKVADLANALFGPTPFGWVDAAIAALDGSRGYNQEILDTGPPQTQGVAPALLNLPVFKSGRTTELTRGIINTIEVTMRTSFPGVGNVVFERQFIIFPDPAAPVPEISAPGDSGSVWLEPTRQMAVGLHFMGESASSIQDWAGANPVPQVVKSLGIRFGPTPDMPTVYRWWHGEQGDHFYTTDPSGELAPGVGYTYESAPFALFARPAPGLTPLYRWYRNLGSDHFYTTDPNGELAPGAGYVYEGITGYICQGPASGLTELYRWWNPNRIDHFYTTDPGGELAPVSGYTFEGLVGWVQPLLG